jgi:hypothetical protein
MEHIIKDLDFKEIMENSIYEVIHHLVFHEESFGVLCNLDKIIFNPKLPKSIMKKFNPFTFFILANYTLQSANIDDKYLTFEAGFGDNDFSSEVKVPLFAIFQIVIDDNIIFLNPCATVAEFEELEEDDDEEKSINAILSNPENIALFKKMKKEE